MRFIYEHDEEEDFVEIHLNEKELNHLLNDELNQLQIDLPACLHTRRSTNVLVRRSIIKPES
jgi:hypothetical protein